MPFWMFRFAYSRSTGSPISLKNISSISFFMLDFSMGLLSTLPTPVLLHNLFWDFPTRRKVRRTGNICKYFPQRYTTHNYFYRNVIKEMKCKDLESKRQDLPKRRGLSIWRANHFDRVCVSELVCHLANMQFTINFEFQTTQILCGKESENYL